MGIIIMLVISFFSGGGSRRCDTREGRSMPPSASDGVPRPRTFVVSAEVSSESDVLDLYGADARCMRIYKINLQESRPVGRRLGMLK